MPVNILMPALSPTMEKGNLARWLKKEGDKVKAGDVIAEIETDKATMEYESIDDGVLAKIVVPEGTADVPVNQLIAVLAAGRRGPEGGCGGGGKGRAAAGTAKAPEPPSRPPHRQRRAPQSSPAAGLRPRRAGSGRSAAHGANRVFASPLARRLAKDAGIDVARVAGLRPARTRHRARRGGGEIRQGARAALRLADWPQAPSDDKIRALFEARQLRGRPARQHAQDHRAAAGRGEADHSAFLPDARLQYRQAPGRTRGDQCRSAQGQGRQARLQALGQRLRHQGARGGACSACRTRT